ncbi:MAG: HAMP domain-containing protein, partial [Chloroflexi bacterium]|nr:HAMP domain-containing protein [Chloroflexota bacterium]
RVRSGLSQADGCGLVALAAAPIVTGREVLGSVSVALPLDADFAAQLNAQTGSNAWLLCRAGDRSVVLGARTLQIDLALDEAVFTRAQTFVGTSRVDGVLSYGEYAPLLDLNGRVIGMLGITQPNQTIVSTPERAAWLFVLLALGCALLVIAEAFLLARRITEPLRTLTAATRAMGEGNLNVPLDVHGYEEIVGLAHAFATMRGKLSESYKALAHERNRYRDFLAVVPHEFKTPLAALAASLELLESDTDSFPAEHGVLVRSIHRSVIRLNSLVDNLLDSASIQAGQFHIVPEPYELARVIEQASLYTQPLLDQKHQLLELDVEQPLPSVMADPRRITQVLINLISNANKYSPADEPLTLRAHSSGGFVRVSLIDQGAGIPASEQRELFQRYVRMNATGAGAPSGMGFGLAIVREIVEQHRGQVGLHSEQGHGTEVWFTLPIASREEIRRALDGDDE